MTSGELSKIFFEAVMLNNAPKIQILLNLSFTASDDKALIKVDVNAINPISGTTALGIAARADDTRTLKILLENNARIDDKDRFGLTALHHAVLCRKLDAVKFLLEQKADPLIKNPNEWTAKNITESITGTDNNEIYNVLMAAEKEIFRPDIEKLRQERFVKNVAFIDKMIDGKKRPKSSGL